MKNKRITKRILRENIQLAIMIVPTILLIGAFSYLPMFGVVLAFKEYKVTKGIWGSDWADPLYKHFRFFLESSDAWRVTRNTLLLNFIFIFVGLIASIVFALILYEVKKTIHVKVYQTFAILPSFLSWVAVSYIVYALLAPETGQLNLIIRFLGGKEISWYQEPKWWPLILTIVKVWHGVGLNCIVYYASLMGIDSELFEAAEMDGATRLQKIRYISIPHLTSIATIMTIMNIGGIFRADFGLFYNVTRNIGALYPTTDVMDTYVFRALMDTGNIGMSSAASLIQSLVCCITLIATNAVVKKIEPENALF